MLRWPARPSTSLAPVEFIAEMQTPIFMVNFWSRFILGRMGDARLTDRIGTGEVLSNHVGTFRGRRVAGASGRRGQTAPDRRHARGSVGARVAGHPVLRARFDSRPRRDADGWAAR